MTFAKNLMGAGFSAGQAAAVGGNINLSLAAAGSAQSDATLIKASLCVATGADGTKGVILPLVQPGDSVLIFNNSASTLKVYPPTGAAIAVPGTGQGSANSAYSQVTYSTTQYTCVSSTQWETISSAGFSGTTAAFTTVTADAIAGGDASLGITGLASTTGGAVVITGGTSSTSGTAGGAASLVGGTPGITGVGGAASVTAAAGGSSSGKGGAASLTAGAGTAGNASGGSVVLTPGAKNGSGIDGVIFGRGTRVTKVTVPAMTDTATIAIADMRQGTIKCTPTAAATYTMPTGTVIAAGLPSDFTTGDSFDFALVNIATNSSYDITVASAASGTTMYGNLVCASNAAVTDISSAIFRLVCSGASTYDIYRIS